ncbi:MAG: chitobiase/beta-hexosaminidase C-terminal domain-containing protein [Saprospirales bacterium]|nr:chitobiase/beta-hexosaminidase C-terminal domain-containing protein [Saprospirales bacterium]
MGRLTDGDEALTYFEVPSPNASNNGSPTYAFAAPPEILPGGHFFDQTIDLDIKTSQQGCLLRYTLDGSLPNDISAVFYQPFSLDSTTTVRARAFCDGLYPSPAVTKTIFIGTDHRLPIVALSTHPDLFWGWESGILVDGPMPIPNGSHYGANYWADVEIPVHFEFFDEKQFQVSCNPGAQVHGGRGRAPIHAKSLRLLAKRNTGRKRSNTVFQGPGHRHLQAPGVAECQRRFQHQPPARRFYPKALYQRQPGRGRPRLPAGRAVPQRQISGRDQPPGKSG